jgi:hypothetical protein
MKETRHLKTAQIRKISIQLSYIRIYIYICMETKCALHVTYSEAA